MSSRGLDWVLGLSWWLVSLSAIFVGGFVALYISYFTAGQLGFAIEGTHEGAIGAAIFLALMSLLLTAIVGAAQGWLLRQYLPIAQWFGATAAGGAMGAAIALGVRLLGGNGLDIASVAVWAGTAVVQWFLLRRFSSRSIVWLIAGVVQIPIALNQPNSMVFEPPIVILVYCTVTAILMTWILQTARVPLKGCLKSPIAGSQTF